MLRRISALLCMPCECSWTRGVFQFTSCLCLQIERSDIQEGTAREVSVSRQQRADSPKRTARRDRRSSPRKGPVQSPLPSLPSNTAELVRSRNRAWLSNDGAAQSVRFSGPVESPVPSLPSNTADMLRQRGGPSDKSASDSNADLERFYNNLYLSQGR